MRLPTVEFARIPPESIKEINQMLKRRFVVLLTAGALASGVGAAVAIADDGQSGDPAAAAACPVLVASPAPQDQNNQVGVDEQATANDIADAADEVQVEADNQGADDQSGDQQGPNDNSEEPDDACQSGE